jgi:predicted amidohydrolase
MTVRVAACAYPIERLADWRAYRAKQERWVADAAASGAQLLVFPEYASLELGAVLVEARERSLAAELEALQALLPEFLALYRRLSREHGVTIVAPSFPEFTAPEAELAGYRNRLRIHVPSGCEGVQEKLMMTRFERELWGVSAGRAQQVFETELGTLGVAICYDSEFPLLVRRQVSAGAQLVLVPSCTDTRAGYFRVQLSCRARALENQCYVVQASTVGEAPWSLSVDSNTGAAGIFGPVDQGFPSDGVIALGALDQPGWIYADLDLALLDRVRREGQVRNHLDWDEPAHLSAALERVRLK